MNIITNTEDNHNTFVDYSSHIKVCSTKKSMITKDNIEILMLSQVPHVSSTIASSLLKHYGSLANILNCLRENSDQFGVNISYTTSAGKIRKIPKNSIAQIKCLFL